MLLGHSNERYPSIVVVRRLHVYNINSVSCPKEIGMVRERKQHIDDDIYTTFDIDSMMCITYVVC